MTKQQLADAAQLASFADRNAGGPIDRYSGKEVWHARSPIRARCPTLPFCLSPLKPGMSGVDLDGVSYRKGAASAIRVYVGGRLPDSVEKDIKFIAKSGGTPSEGDQRTGARYGSPEGYRERRPPGSVRAIPGDGNSNRDDHRRQRLNRFGHRAGSRRR